MTLIRKGLTVIIILITLGTCIIPSIAQDTEKPLPTSKGDWLYVGGSGPGNYTNIQNAVDNASSGDTIFVYSGVYTYFKPGNRGCIDIQQKNITLIGQDKDTTILDGNWSNGIVHVDSPIFSISGFTVRNSGSSHGPGWFGIEIGFNYNEETTIHDNIICGGHNDGIIVWGGKCSVYNNTIFGNAGAIYMSTGNGEIFNNKISENTYGIHVLGYSFVHDNIIQNNTVGIFVEGSSKVERNQIEQNDVGVQTGNSKAKIQKNNFVDNEIQAQYSNLLVFINLFLPLPYRFNWRGNYWNDWTSPLPRPIKGYWSYLFLPTFEIIGSFPSVQFDLLPSTTPYDIKLTSV